VVKPAAAERLRGIALLVAESKSAWGY